ncbi:response regulator [Blastomonas sp. SL216]|uniref:response regulator n=1 Tax=Blastomonas sp. SL216 TaxID=2995169 RepID=UPI00237797B7|nr:response regulator [Blastomonas sp. SL216]
MDPAVRVLIVEDEVLIAMLLTELVEQLGCSVCDVAATEAGAVAMARAYEPGLIIVDAGLHEGSGVSAMNTILEQGFVPHIYVTGDKHLVRTLAGQAIVLEKPFFARDLSNGIERALAAADGP